MQVRRAPGVLTKPEEASVHRQQTSADTSDSRNLASSWSQACELILFTQDESVLEARSADPSDHVSRLRVLRQWLNMIGCQHICLSTLMRCQHQRQGGSSSRVNLSTSVDGSVERVPANRTSVPSFLNRQT